MFLFVCFYLLHIHFDFISFCFYHHPNESRVCFSNPNIISIAHIRQIGFFFCSFLLCFISSLFLWICIRMGWWECMCVESAVVWRMASRRCYGQLDEKRCGLSAGKWNKKNCGPIECRECLDFFLIEMLGR